MSRMGKKPILIPKGVKVEQSGQTIKATGTQGTLQIDCQPEIKVNISAEQIVLENTREESRFHRAMHGTMRALISNILTGVSKGFEKKLEIYGTGYNLKIQGNKLVLAIGFCHPIEIPVPKSVKVNIEVAATRGDDAPAKFTLFSADRMAVGQLAADIRKVRPPEPYKGKGIRYADEVVRHKVGKAFASGPA